MFFTLPQLAWPYLTAKLLQLIRIPNPKFCFVSPIIAKLMLVAAFG
jgi:hypothetical protein